MNPQRLCRACSVCAFPVPERCSAYRLACAIHEEEKVKHCPDMETYVQYFQSALADGLAAALEDFMADLRARLNKEHYYALISHFYHGRSLRAMAREEGVSVEAMRQRVNSALEKVRSQWCMQEV